MQKTNDILGRLDTLQQEIDGIKREITRVDAKKPVGYRCPCGGKIEIQKTSIGYWFASCSNHKCPFHFDNPDYVWPCRDILIDALKPWLVTKQEGE